MNRHLARIVACVTAVGVLSTTATGMAAANTPPVVAEADNAKMVELVQDLSALHGRIEAAKTANDSVALLAALAELRPALDKSYDLARTEAVYYYADRADSTAAQIERILPLGIPSPLTAVFGLVGSLLALVGGLVGTLIGLLPIPIPVPIPIPGVPAPGAPAPGLPLPGVPGAPLPGVPGAPLPEVPGAPLPEVPGGAPVPGAPAPGTPAVPGVPLPLP